ncbi:MAG: HAMP domain-containing protein, partial [Lysobacteraceae bacterium]
MHRASARKSVFSWTLECNAGLRAGIRYAGVWSVPDPRRRRVGDAGLASRRVARADPATHLQAHGSPLAYDRRGDPGGTGMPATGPDQGGAGAAPASDRVHWRNSLRTRIALWSAAVNVALLLLVVAAIAWFARGQILDNAKRETRASAQEAAQRLDTAFDMVTITARGVSDLVANAELDNEELSTTLRAMARATPGVSGGLLVLEKGTDGRPAFARYISANGKDRDFIADGYDYRARAWYQRTLAAQRGWWSEPYLSQTAGQVWIVTYNLPLRPSGRGATTRGMVSLDLPLSQLTDHFETLAHLPGWRLSLVAPEGMFAINPEPGVALHETVASYIDSRGRHDLAVVARAVRLHQAGQFTHTDARMGEQRYTVVEPVGTSGWSLLVAQSYDLIVARLDRALYLLLAAGTLLALLSTLLVRHLAKRISRPVEHLAESTSRLALGQYDWPVPHTRRRDEVGRMARTLEHARTSIEQQLVEIGEMGAARQKLQSELSIARDIQRAMLSPPRRVRA